VIQGDHSSGTVKFTDISLTHHNTPTHAAVTHVTLLSVSVYY